MPYIKQHSIHIGLCDRHSQQHKPSLSDISVALLSQFNTTDTREMPTVAGIRRKGLHEHAVQVKPAV